MRTHVSNHAWLYGFTGQQVTAICGFTFVTMRGYADLQMNNIQ